MTTARPLCVVTLPARTLAEARVQIGAAETAKADIVELRVDRLLETDRERVGLLLPTRIPVLATYRSRLEGGEGDDDPGRRRAVLDRLGQAGFPLVDREIDRDGPRPSPPGVSWVDSVHLTAEGAGRLPNLLKESSSPSPRWKKIVLAATFETLEREILPLLDPPPESPYCLHTTGPTGPVLRASADRLGMAAVYAALPFHERGPEAVEPSQIPVDRLRQAGPEPSRPRFALLGHPVAHSLSPQLHTGWMAGEDAPGLYVALETPTASDFRAAVRVLPALGFLGLNVTHPWKQLALEVAEARSDVARRTGVANTLTFRSRGLEAENTDYLAVRRRLLELRDRREWRGDPVLVVGSGGAARSAVVAVQDLGGEARMLARDSEAARRVAHELGATVAGDPEGTVGSVVIHATPAGRRESPVLGVNLAPYLGPATRLLDFVYRPEVPVLSVLCRQAGARYEDGERLLHLQAAESYTVWWGHPPRSAHRTVSPEGD